MPDQTPPQARFAPTIPLPPYSYVPGHDLPNLVLAGFMTHACINSTARGAFNLGYQATIVANATATRDLPAAGGGVVPAEHVQAASLAAAGDIFAVIVPGLEEIG